MSIKSPFNKRYHYIFKGLLWIFINLWRYYLNSCLWQYTHLVLSNLWKSQTMLKLCGRIDVGSAGDCWMPGGPFHICITAGPAWNFWTSSEMVRCCTSRTQ